ncbi:MAG: hypothetical protein H6512_02315 [Acidimicrobiia bacterium]|nr:hypothetical protein [Acidimicrobiia bacterium]
MDGEPSRLHREVSAGCAERAPEVIENATYSYLDTQRYQTMLEMELPTGMIDPSAVEMELGASPVAEELRGLQLPRRPT